MAFFRRSAARLSTPCLFGCMLLFVEISTIFLSLRTLMFYHGYDKCMFYNINVFLIAFFFLFGRIIYQIGITFFLAFPRLYDEIYSKKMSTL